MTTGASIIFRRNSHFFVANAGRIEELESHREIVHLVADQLLHPLVPRHYIVRKGRIRISHFLEDGREITRAVLQAGSVIRTQDNHLHGDKPAADLYSLSGIVIMALGETELWAFSENELADFKL
jgi:hypothetical protein